MFKKLLNEIKQFEQGVQVSITLPLDGDGYFDRRCQSEECGADFKVLFADWRDKVSDERVFCPVCRYEAPSDSWNTPDQEEYARRVAVNYAQERIHHALEEDARAFNRSQRPGFISLSLSVKPGSPQILLPVNVVETMRQTFICEACGCHYASIGLAYFCPSCGHNSIIVTFEKTVETVRQVMLQIPTVRSALETVVDRDIAWDSVRYTLEDSLGRLIGAFQHYAESLFNQRPTASSMKQRKNVFQNLSESSALWKTLTGKSYEDLLPKSEFAELEQLFQKRHLIAHRNGIVDQEYLAKSGDTSYSIAQRLVVSEATV